MIKDRFNTRRMVALALFCALAYAVTFVFRIKVGYLTYDAKSAVICIAGIIFGPTSAILISAVTALIEMITVSDTAFWGLLMNFVATALYASIAALIYRRVRSVWGAILALVSASLAMTVAMLGMNLIITPVFNSNMTVDDVMKIIPTLLLPFNIVKATLNSALVMMFYKPLTTALRYAKVLPRDDAAAQYRFGVRTAIVILGALVVCVGCVLILMLALNGSFKLI